MKYWKYIAIEIMAGMIGALTYPFLLPNFYGIIITHICLAIVIILAILSIRNEFVENTGVEIGG
jgi:uncharacterized membrane protein YcaP (DUF421 family)